MDGTEARKMALGFASLLAIAAWRAIAIDGEKADPARLAAVEAALGAGDADFGIYIQKSGDNLYISAIALPPGPQDPFSTDQKLVIQGPMVLSRDQLAALSVIPPEAFN